MQIQLQGRCCDIRLLVNLVDMLLQIQIWNLCCICVLVGCLILISDLEIEFHLWYDL